MKYCFLLFLLISLSGCGLFLPAGDPPPGNILNNDPVKTEKVSKISEVTDYFTSALSIALLSNCPGEKVLLQSDAASSSIARKIFLASADISGNHAAAGNTPWILKTTTAGQVMQMQLFNNGKAVWQDKIQFTFDADKLY